ncbi:MAG: enoyl-CoA hydratase/isomerase family protein, partial [Aquihabitans sp.]
EAHEMGLVWRLAEPDDLLAEARRHAEVLAAKPISSLVACKRVVTEPLRPQIEAARQRENDAFVELLGSPANLEAFAAFAEGRKPNFVDLPGGD